MGKRKNKEKGLVHYHLLSRTSLQGETHNKGNLLSSSHSSFLELKFGVEGSLQRLVKETLEREKLKVHTSQGVTVRSAQLHMVVGLFGLTNCLTVSSCLVVNRRRYQTYSNLPGLRSCSVFFLSTLPFPFLLFFLSVVLLSVKVTIATKWL